MSGSSPNVRRTSHPFRVLHPNHPEKIPDLSAEIDFWKNKARLFENTVLNLEEQLAFYHNKLQKAEENQDKVQVLLRQNTNLLQENESLLKIIHQKKMQIQAWKSKHDSEFTSQMNVKATLEMQSKRALDQIQRKQYQHRAEINKLLNQISRLQDHCAQTQSLKNIEIHNLKAKYQNQNLTQLQSLKRSQHQNNQAKIADIRKLREQINDKSFLIDQLRRDNKIQAEKLNGEISNLKNQLSKAEQAKQREIQFMLTSHQNQLYQVKRAGKKDLQQAVANNDMTIKRLQNEINKKNLEIEQQESKHKRIASKGDNEGIKFIEQKNRLQAQLSSMGLQHKQQLKKQKEKYESSLNFEIDNLKGSHNIQVNLLEDQIGSLKNLIQLKQNQVNQLVNQNLALRDDYKKRSQSQDFDNLELKKRLCEIVQANARQVQTLKVRLAHLYQADIKLLRASFQSQIQNMKKENNHLQQVLIDRNQQIQDLHKQKAAMRNDYEKMLNKMKGKQENTQIQFQTRLINKDRELNASVSQVRMETQNYIRENDSQLVKTNFLEKEVQKLRSIIEDKIRQIASLNNKYDQMKNQLSEDNIRLQKIIDEMNLKAEQANQQVEEQKQFYRNQITKKDKAYKDLDQQLSNQIVNLRQEIQNLKKSKDDLRGTIDQLNQQLKRTLNSLAHKQQHWEADKANFQKLAFQTEASHNQQRQKMINHTNAQNQKLKQLLGQKCMDYQSQIAELKKLLQLKQREVREGMGRQKNLNHRVDILVDASERLSQIQNKVINIGVNNNLVKNLSEMFRHRHQQK